MFYLPRNNSFLVSVDIAIYFDSVFVEKDLFSVVFLKFCVI